MKELNLIIVLPILFVLTGCGEKDAKYYYKHPDELSVILNQCENKISDAKNTDNLDESFKTLENDEVCIMATQAQKAILLGGIDKVIAKEGSKPGAFWEV